MRFPFIICCLFILQTSVGAGDKESIKPAVEFIAKYADHIQAGKEFVKIVGPYVKAFVNLGKFVKCVVEACLEDVKGEEQRREILADVRVVNEKIEMMGRTIDDNYNSLKAFAVEHDFYTTFIVTAETQFEFLRGVVKYRTQESIDLFEKHYRENHPIHSVVEISKRLSHHNVTNPIVSAMRADPLRTTQTFRKWTTCFYDLFTTMHISYLFHEGLNGRDVTESAQVFEKLSEASSILNSFIFTYKNDYWPSAVQHVMREVRDNHKTLSNLAKANYLKHELRKIETRDSFLILVFDHASDREQAYRAADANNVILSRPDGMVVYRSRLARNTTDEYREDFFSDVNWLRKRSCYENSDGLDDSAQELFREISDAGFVALLKNCQSKLFKDKNAAIRTVGDETGNAWIVKLSCFKPSKNLLHYVPVNLFVAPH